MSYIGDGVLSWVPEQCRVDTSGASAQNAADFNPTTRVYWTSKVGSMIPGLVLGGICLVGFLFMLVWICVRWARQRRRRKAAKAAQEAEQQQQQQFLAADGSGMASAPPAFHHPPPLGRRRRRAANMLTFTLLLLSLAAVGTAAWALGESVVQSNSVISDFWDLVHEVQTKVDQVLAQFVILSSSLDTLEPASATIRDKAAELQPALAAVGISADRAQQVLQLLGALPSASMEAASDTINITAIPVLRNDILKAIYSVLTWESPTMSIEDTWRFVVLAVLWGLVILGVVAATALCFWMRFGKWASFAVALVWFLNMLVMLGGVGLFNGVEVVSGEACLYTESFTYSQVDHRLRGTARSMMIAGLDYYIGVRNLTTIANDTLTTNVASYDPQLAEDLLGMLVWPGVDLTQVLDAAEEINSTLWALGNSTEVPQRLLQLGVAPGTVQAVRDAVWALSGVLSSTSQLVVLLQRSSIQPIYHHFKSYLCCEVNSAGYYCWLSWTLAGSVTLAYCVAASARVIWQTILPATRGWGDSSLSEGLDPPPAPPPPDTATHAFAFKEAGASDLSEFATSKSCTSSLECPQGQQQPPGVSIQTGAGSAPPSPQLSAYHAGQAATAPPG